MVPLNSRTSSKFNIALPMWKKNHLGVQMVINIPLLNKKTVFVTCPNTTRLLQGILSPHLRNKRLSEVQWNPQTEIRMCNILPSRILDQGTSGRRHICNRNGEKKTYYVSCCTDVGQRMGRKCNNIHGLSPNVNALYSLGGDIWFDVHLVWVRFHKQ